MAARVDYLSFLFFRVPDPSLLAGEARELRLLGQEEIANVRESDLCFQSGSTRKARLRKGSKKTRKKKLASRRSSFVRLFLSFSPLSSLSFSFSHLRESNCSASAYAAMVSGACWRGREERVERGKCVVSDSIDLTKRERAPLFPSQRLDRALVRVRAPSPHSRPQDRDRDGETALKRRTSSAIISLFWDLFSRSKGRGRKKVRE